VCRQIRISPGIKQALAKAMPGKLAKANLSKDSMDPPQNVRNWLKFLAPAPYTVAGLCDVEKLLRSPFI
jgi:hypothetical protein